MRGNDDGLVRGYFNSPTDPEFQRDQNAAYYARVIEIPTSRWSMFDAKELGIESPAKLHKTIQERAFTSPIFYDHH